MVLFYVERLAEAVRAEVILPQVILSRYDMALGEGYTSGLHRISPE